MFDQELMCEYCTFDLNLLPGQYIKNYMLLLVRLL